MSTNEPARIDGGVPTGGQFTVQARNESDVSLSATTTTSTTFFEGVDLLADTSGDEPVGSVAARRRRLAELAAKSTWDETTDPLSWQPSVESDSVRFSIKHNAGRARDAHVDARTFSAARSALRGSRTPGRVVHLFTDDTSEVLEVTGHPDDPIQVHLPGFRKRTPLRVTKGCAVIHAGNGLASRRQAPVVDVTIAPGASVLVFGARGGQVNVTVEGDGAAVVVVGRHTACDITVTSTEGSVDTVGPTNATVVMHAPDQASR